MKTPYFIAIILSLILGFAFSQAFVVSANTPSGDPNTIFLPLVVTRPGSTASTAIIIDHTTTDLSKIPDYWIEQAKQLTLHYAHTSHGSQLTSGLAYLENVDPKYAFAVSTGVPALPSGSGLRIYDGTYDGSSYQSYATPELYWAAPDGVLRTQTVANTGLFDYSMWAWCGQQSSNSIAEVNRYLAQMDAFEKAYPGMKFILMTGHTDGTGVNGTLYRNNNLLRDFAKSENMVLFDFADIESYDPDGVYYPNTDDSCPWCNNWCASHPDQCRNLPGCAHSHGFNCVQKGKAFWWMMARLAGWDGVPVTQ